MRYIQSIQSTPLSLSQCVEYLRRVPNISLLRKTWRRCKTQIGCPLRGLLRENCNTRDLCKTHRLCACRISPLICSWERCFTINHYQKLKAGLEIRNNLQGTHCNKYKYKYKCNKYNQFAGDSLAGEEVFKSNEFVAEVTQLGSNSQWMALSEYHSWRAKIRSYKSRPERSTGNL